MPGIFVTTDFIVGFPGETEEDFQRTLSLFDEGGFNGAFVFKYSARPGTPSADWADDIPETIKEDRHARLLGAVMARSTRKAPAGLV
jgi:tRNA-2-methylthio-N6-dimethylallyladenosine synthase